ncbi:MAG TPA: DNA polymerase [Mesorhizobium sp.]|nr:DNA polymerase [Mesorhizobium sp.]
MHVIARRLHDLSGMLSTVGDREVPFPVPHGRGAEFHHGDSPDQPGRPQQGVNKARDIFIPDLSLEAIRVKPRDFG